MSLSYTLFLIQEPVHHLAFWTHIVVRSWKDGNLLEQNISFNFTQIPRCRKQVLKWLSSLVCLCFKSTGKIDILKIRTFLVSRALWIVAALLRSSPWTFQLPLYIFELELRREKAGSRGFYLVWHKPVYTAIDQRTNGPVNAHLRPEIYTNKLVWLEW